MVSATRWALRSVLAGILGLLIAEQGMAGNEAFYQYHAKPGDTLIGLGHTLLVRPSDWPRIARLNQIGNPRRIPIGAAIRIPVGLMKATPRPGAVLAVVGEAHLTAPGGQTTPAQAGASIAPGTDIRTGNDGYVTIRLADGSVLKVQSATQAKVERSNQYEAAGFFASTLRLLRGRLEAVVSHLTGGEPRFEVKTPQAVLGVRGTEFRIAVDEALQRTNGEVLDGAVAVTAAGGKRHAPRLVAAGFGTQVTPGQGALPPVHLNAPPDLSAVPALHERILVRIGFPPVPGTTLYRAQVAQDEGFLHVQSEQTSTEPSLRFAGLPDGHYFLRVRTGDVHGIEGPDAVRQFHLKARPEPPIVSLPASGGKLRAETVAFSWAAQPEAARYRIQIAHDAAFQHLAHEAEAVTDTPYSVALPVGDFVWRVASIRPDGDQGPFGDIRAFQLRAPPAQPAPPLVDDKTLTFHWQGEPGQTFEFQMAGDAAFAQPLVAQALAEPAIKVDRPDHGGRLFIRYRAIDADGFVGPYTAPQVVTLPGCLLDGSGACVHDGSGGTVSGP